MIIDVHAHIFPDKIAEKAAQSIGAFYGYPMRGDGRAETLLRFGDEAGIDRFLVHSVAMTPGHVERVNEFIAESVRAHPGRFTGFLSLHPDMPDIGVAIDRAVGDGLAGVKLHPDMQRFATDGERARPMFEAVARRKLPLLIHAGDKRYRYSTPGQILNLHKALPELTIIAAHFGGYSQWDESAKLLAGSGIYVDCSSSLFALTPEAALGLIRAFGADQVLFGTDFPMWRAADELEKIRSLGLTQAELDMILHQNAERLLGI